MSEKEDPVAKDHRFIVGGVAFIVVFFLIWISAKGVATDPKPLDHPDSWYTYILRFQTLIGGLLVIGAAFITIQQMRKSDWHADKRHNDLMKLQLRPQLEALQVLRHKYLRSLERLSNVNQMYASELYVILSEAPESFNRVKVEQTIYLELRHHYEVVADELNERSWNTYYDNLSGLGRDHYDQLKNAISDFLRDHPIEVFRDGNEEVFRGAKELVSQNDAWSAKAGIERVDHFLKLLIDELKREDEWS